MQLLSRVLCPGRFLSGSSEIGVISVAHRPTSTVGAPGWISGQGDDADVHSHGWLLVPDHSKGDYDGDGDVDLQDSGHFQRCFAAEAYIDGTLHVGCSVFDFDDDIDLDLDDYAAFQSAFTGPTAPNNNPNGPG
ncbi:MAG: hypothetical protein IH988_09535 [Planctomycetes bacterium]|nr:hypothetical protein [Planctomycetota bacterium]